MYDSEGYLIFYKTFISQHYISQLHGMLFYKLRLICIINLCFINPSESASVSSLMHIFAKS